MRALTVQQPWAWAIVHGGKDVENRTQAWTYRGPLAIHAGQTWAAHGGETVPGIIAQDSALLGADVAREVMLLEAQVRGAIIGVVDLVDVHVSQVQCCWSPWAQHADGPTRPVVHLVLANPRPLAMPVPCKGRLGLWTPPAEVLAELEAAIA